MASIEQECVINAVQEQKELKDLAIWRYTSI
jgi:hypothetical protein